MRQTREVVVKFSRTAECTLGCIIWENGQTVCASVVEFEISVENVHDMSPVCTIRFGIIQAAVEC